MEEILRAVQDLFQAIRLVAGQALDLVSALVDLLRTSSISLPALDFIGIIIVAFLLGLLLGRISKRGVPEAFENSREREADRVVLDLERLTPLGLSAEEEAESEVMDLSGHRPDGGTDKNARRDRPGRLRPGTAPDS